MLTALVCLFLTQLLRAPLIVGEFHIIFGLLLAGGLAGTTKLPLALPRRAIVSLALSFFIPAVLLLEAALLQPTPGILLLRARVFHLGSKVLLLATVSLSLPLIVTGVALPAIVVVLLLVLMHKLKFVFALLILALFGSRVGASIAPLERLSEFLLAPAIPAPAMVGFGAAGASLVFASLMLRHQLYIPITSITISQSNMRITIEGSNYPSKSIVEDPLPTTRFECLFRSRNDELL